MVKIIILGGRHFRNAAGIALLANQVAAAEAAAPIKAYKIAKPVALNPSPIEMHPNDDWRKKNKRKFR